MVLNVFVTSANRRPLDRVRRTSPKLREKIRLITYEQLFARHVVPAGTSVFTDFDFLSTFELDSAIQAAMAAEQAGGRVLNHPAKAAERVELLRRLREEGLSKIEVTRLEDNVVPSRWPVFVRCEDQAVGPESDLIHDADALADHLQEMQAKGKSLKRRIAVSFEAQRDAQGFYRKYGAFVIGDRIIPQHVMRSEGWVVKNSGKCLDAAFNAEELEYVQTNPHEAQLRELARIAGIGFGRIDYGLVDGNLTVFEINTNPNFPRFRGSSPERQQRRTIIEKNLLAAFEAVDSQGAAAEFQNATGFIRHHKWWGDMPHSLLEARRWRRMGRKLLRSEA